MTELLKHIPIPFRPLASSRNTEITVVIKIIIDIIIVMIEAVTKERL